MAIAFAALLVASLPNLADPFVRSDDFPALLLKPDDFWMKTLYEGRWINWLWHLRGLETPSWLNNIVYLGLWAIAAGAMAINALGRSAGLGWTALLAVAIALGPASLLISSWFNTLIPGMALLALFAVLSLFLSPRLLRSALLVFVPLTLMAYTTYPFLLLLICATQSGASRRLADLVRLLALFAVAFVGGMLLLYGLNHAVHGVFGIPMADFRNPNPATDFASLIGNLPDLQAAAQRAVNGLSFQNGGILALVLCAFGAGGVALWRRDKAFLGYVLAVLAVGLALLSVQVLKTGIELPARSLIFVWCGLMIVAVAGLRTIAAALPRYGAAVKALPALICLAAGLSAIPHWQSVQSWQAETRVIASGLGAADEILIEGDYRALASAKRAGIQNEIGLTYRLEQVTGRPAVLCDATACDGRSGMRLSLPVMAAEH